VNSGTRRNKLIQKKRELESGLKMECGNFQKQDEEEMERNDQGENHNKENEEKLS